MSFCGASYWGVVNSREDGVPLKADFLAALLPLLCIPAFFSLFTGLYKWYKNDFLAFYSPRYYLIHSDQIANNFRKDDDWKISRGVYLFVGMGMLLLFGAVAAVIVTIRPWTVSKFCVTWDISNLAFLYNRLYFMYHLYTGWSCWPPCYSVPCICYWGHPLLDI